jgi:hypothetical protein
VANANAALEKVSRAMERKPADDSPPEGIASKALLEKAKADS